MPTAPQHHGHLPEDMAMVPVPSHVLDIINRITHGDDIWRGDLSMGVYFSPEDGMYRVIGLDAHQQPYVAATADYCDQRLLNQLVEGDWQRGGLFDAIDKANKARQAELDAKEDDRLDEMADKLAHALRKDAHNIAGVSSRDMWAVDWKHSAKARACSSPS